VINSKLLVLLGVEKNKSYLSEKDFDIYKEFVMKNLKLIGIAVLVAVVGFSMTACP